MGRKNKQSHRRSSSPSLKLGRLFKKALVLLAALGSLWLYRLFPAPGYDAITVAKVHDGDTIKLANGDRVRLIGIDCPELHESDKLYRDAARRHQDIAVIQAMGKEADEFTRKLVLGRKVRLEFDLERRDKYGRLLAYVYLYPGPGDQELDSDVLVYEDLLNKSPDKSGEMIKMIFLNASILKAGFAQVMIYPPNTMHADFFQRLNREAREAHRGLWREK